MAFVRRSDRAREARASPSAVSRYVFLNGGDDYGVVRGKRGAQHGVVIKKTKTAFVIGNSRR